MQRSLIEDSPKPRDRTPFLYAFVVVKGVVESSAASSRCAGELVHAINGVEADSCEAEAGGKMEEGVMYRRTWVVGRGSTG